uniref:Little elongation complex subunit 2 C-terminal domain-containing protein n=1 Tax=Stomoxys calcitrans TaxID=35570 RepID=A0A1I8P8B0_STOCA
MNNFPYDRRMNTIFRNQPSYTYFNKSCADPQDILFRSLNEIDEYYLQPEQLANQRAFEKFTVSDPRTKQTVNDIFFNHSGNITTKIFRSPKWSCLNISQHSVGVRIVKARQEEAELDESDFYIWHNMEKLRQKESQEFHKFVYEFSQANKEILYEPTKKLTDLYNLWYVQKTERLLQKYPDTCYNTHLGLPHLKMCKEALKDQWAEITKVECLNSASLESSSHKGLADSIKLDFKPLDRNIEKYFKDRLCTEKLKEELENKARQKFLHALEYCEANTQPYYMPLESLLFLLTAGDYVDIPLEMLIEIKETGTSQSGQKYIFMDSPLPPRQMGWHTYQQVVELAALGYMSSIQAYSQNEDMKEISACAKDPLHYKVQTIEEYMQSYKPDIDTNFSQTLFKWQLKARDKEPSKEIYTVFDSFPCSNGPLTFKLEHKPKFGCELMTKYELLRDWFNLKLRGKPKSNCYRLNTSNFQTMLKESQSLSKLELQLSTTYHIVMPHLLSNLYEFLNLLTSMPCGPYMLRYNPKFKDKMMLCKPSQEVTQNTVHLHELLKSQPSELLFMSQQSYLPIADNLCSLMHLEHQTLPCTFRPSRKFNLQQSTGKNLQKPYVPLNDKEWILEKCKKQQVLAANKNTPQYRAQKKKAQRARRAQARRIQQTSKETT